MRTRTSCRPGYCWWRLEIFTMLFHSTSKPYVPAINDSRSASYFGNFGLPVTGLLFRQATFPVIFLVRYAKMPCLYRTNRQDRSQGTRFGFGGQRHSTGLWTTNFHASFNVSKARLPLCCVEILCHHNHVLSISSLVLHLGDGHLVDLIRRSFSLT